MAALVAVVVAALFHFREVEEQLSKFASIVMVDSEFLGQLNKGSLFKLRRKIAAVVLEKVVTNREHYDFYRIHEALEEVLFRELAEATTGGEYRTDYEETVDIRFYTGAELALRKGADGPQPSGAASERLYAEITTVSRYKVVSPRKQEAPHKVECTGILARVPFLRENQQVEWLVGSCPTDQQPVQLSFPSGTANERLEYSGRANLKFSSDGLINVCTQCVEVETADEAPFMLKQMNMMTDAPQLTLTSNVPVKLFRIHQMGLGQPGERRGETSGVVTLPYRGWMAKNHGYLLIWAPSAVRAAISERDSWRPAGPSSVRSIPPAGGLEPHQEEKKEAST